MNPQRRQTLILVAAGLGAGTAGALLGPLFLQQGSGAAELLSTRFTDPAGVEHSLRRWDDQVRVCNFWATWCAPCREEMPMLMEVRERFAARRVEFVGVAIDSAANVRQFLATTPVSYPLLIAGIETMELLRRLGNSAGGLPYTVILDRGGAIAYRKLGALKRPELEAELSALV